MGDNILVCDYMRLSSVFIYEEDTLSNAIQAMKSFDIDRISIIKKDFSIVGYIDNKRIKDILKEKAITNTETIKNTQIKKIIKDHNFPITLYPKMKVINAYSAMKCFNIKCLPVVDNPWEKKIIGFLWLDDILPIVEKNYIKIPV